jgi:hypothetical protein
VTGPAPTIADIAATWVVRQYTGDDEDLLYTLEAEYARS